MKKTGFSLQILDSVFEKIEAIKKVHRILIYICAFVLLIGPFIYFSFLPKHTKISQLETTLNNKKIQLANDKRLASQLPKWRKDYQLARNRFELAKKALPQQQEIPSLLTSISESGQESGLDFLLFRPMGEKQRQVYAEIPVSIKVTGSYHEVATFFDKVSRLPRLVNIDDINLSAPKTGNKLDITFTALTYRFVEAQPQKGPATAK